MTTQHTHQQLARNSEVLGCPHPAEMFCINCVIYELIMRRDSRYDVAAIAMLDLRRLAKLREGGTAWGDAWSDILDPVRLQADLSSDDPVRREAAETAQQSVGDFIIYRGAINRRLTPRAHRFLREIEYRVRERHAQVERDGIEADIAYVTVH